MISKKLDNLKDLIEILKKRRSFLLKNNSYETLITFFEGYMLGLDSIGDISINSKIEQYIKKDVFNEQFSTSWYDWLYYSNNFDDEKSTNMFFQILESFIESPAAARMSNR